MSIDNRKKKEELKEVVQEAIEEPIEEPVPNLEETPHEETIEEPIKQTEEVVEDKIEEPKPSPDYKEKYSESSKESLTQYFKNKKIKETIDEANNIPEPTEEELVVFTRSTGSNYDDLDDFTKAMVKKALLSEQRWGKVAEIVKESRDIDAWADKVTAFTDAVETAAKYPLIDDNADDFRKFCMKAARRGMDLEDLATSFLYGLASMPIKKSKGSVLLSGGSTGRGEEKPAGLTDEDAKRIRESDPKEFRRLVKAGKIKIEI